MAKRSGDPQRSVRRTLADGTVKEYRYDRRRALPTAGPLGSLGALLDGFRNSPALAGRAKATQVQYRIYLKFWEKLAYLDARSIKRAMVLNVRDDIAMAHGNGAAAVFGRITSAMFTWGLDRGHCDTNPAARLPPLPVGVLPAWPEAAIRHALAELSEPLRRVVVLALHTGQRRGDLCALPWSAYDGRTIRLRQEKTGAVLAIPCHPDLIAELAAWKRDRTSTMILTSPRCGGWTAPHLSREMKAGLEAIGLNGLNVHGLRKAAARRLAEAGCTAHEIAAITGHRTLAMVQFYTQSADQERLAQAAVGKVSDLSQRIGKRTRKLLIK